MRTIVEGMLPAQFLLDLGTYMQTAAHTELAIWQITMYAEGANLHSADDYREYANLKLGTRELLRRFQSCADRCPPFIARRIRLIAEAIIRFNEVRNLAAHGAFFIEDHTEGVLGVAHYFARGTGASRELYEARQVVRQHDVDTELHKANELLHDVIALRSMVQDWRCPYDPAPR